MKHIKKYLGHLWIILFMSIACAHLAQAGEKNIWVILQTTFATQEEMAVPISTDELLCAYCNNVLKNPHQDPQGRRVCQSCGDTMKLCIQPRIPSDSQTAVQHLMESFPESGSHGVNISEIVRSLSTYLEESGQNAYRTHPDINMANRIATIRTCPVECQDCQHTLALEEMGQHAVDHRFVCELCGFEPSGSLQEREMSMDSHAQYCVKPCVHCEIPFTKDDLALHETGCSMRQISCSNCKEEVTLGEYGTHCIQKMSEGTHDEVTCQLCNRLVSSLDYPDHFQTLHNHDNLTCPDCFQNFKTGEQLFQHVTQNHPQLVMDIRSTDPGYESSSRKQLYHILEVYRLSSSRPSQENITDKVAALSQSMTRLELQCNETGHGKDEIGRLERMISEFELQLQAHLASTYNGVFIWRVPEYSRRRQEALSGKTTSIYSPPFYTGRNGYKMCLRTYLNGDGIGFNTHFSAYLSLMKGEYDALLPWPFTYKVSFILLDQSGEGKHIIQTFKPSPKSSSFKRPQEPMNIASGCPKFCEIGCLEKPEYVQDDVFFLKCIVDTSHIPHP